MHNQSATLNITILHARSSQAWCLWEHQIAANHFKGLNVLGSPAGQSRRSQVGILGYGDPASKWVVPFRFSFSQARKGCTRTHTHTQTNGQTDLPTHARANTHARKHAGMHARTHAHAPLLPSFYVFMCLHA